MPTLDTIEHVLKLTVMYGGGTLFALAFLYGVAYGCWKLLLLVLRLCTGLVDHTIGILANIREWVPKWFGAQVETFQSSAESMRTLTETLGPIALQVGEIHEVVVVKAAAEVDEHDARVTYSPIPATCQGRDCHASIRGRHHLVGGKYLCDECYEERQTVRTQVAESFRTNTGEP